MVLIYIQHLEEILFCVKIKVSLEQIFNLIQLLLYMFGPKNDSKNLQ